MAKIKLSDIKLNPDNPRKIAPARLKKLMDSISEFSAMLYLRPMVVDENNMILGGNQRYLALKALKFKEIPGEWVKVADKLSEAEKQRFIIADNLPFGEWEQIKLEENWQVDDLQNWGLELEAWNEDPEPEPDEDRDYDAKEPEALMTEIKRGDLFMIGDSFLMCGDAKLKDDVNRLARLNVAYDSLKGDILQAKTVGYIRMLTASHRFVVSLQAHRFTPPIGGQ